LKKKGGNEKNKRGKLEINWKEVILATWLIGDVTTYTWLKFQTSKNSKKIKIKIVFEKNMNILAT
jgi:hypothetical protein